MKHGQGKILVVDDNQVNRELLVRRLKRERHLVTAAINGFQALEIIQSQPFDLVLLDIMMPQMNGYEV
ncbi:MAG: response regulator, partial [Okeania sp. SIO2H7]|nr:response regulator [Okeania sp. SIO2H7]